VIAAGLPLLIGCQGLASSGSKAGAALAASSSSLSFGSVQKGKSSSLTESLTNAGGAAVAISEANVSGTGFSVIGLSLPITLSPNHSVTFTLTFAPSAPGSASGTLAVVSTADNSPLDIGLSGTGMAQGQLSVSPASLNFGNVVVGTNSSLNGTLTAAGSPVTISAASLDSGEFALSGISLPATLGAGQTTSFTVTFKPAAAGTASAALSFSSDAANSPAAQALTGNGTGVSQHSVDLTWDVSTGPDAVGYNIYRGGVSGGPYARVNSVLDSSTAYTDSTVASGRTYYYVTTAVDGSGVESGYSSQVRAVIPTP
jgi:Abnormal spindle-like microcephaly-assoc'd, ASPM-SPD-2-Hydin